MIKKLRVTVDGKSYEVTVELPDESEASNAPVAAPASAPPPVSAPPAPTAPPPAVPVAQAAPPAISASGPGGVPSPLAGRIITIAVKIGQDVKQNDHLLTLEAMKMNTFVFAPKDGKVAEIKVAVGDAVNEGQELARIE